MAAMLPGDDGEIACGINVAPLVDVMLVLLVVFMLTVRAASGAAVPVDLPKAHTATTSAVQGEPLVVTVGEGGAVTIDGAPVTDEALRSRASKAAAGSKDARAVVVARAHVDHGHVVHVLDELRRGGLARTALAAEKKP